jgi:hypothetical protein
MILIVNSRRLEAGAYPVTVPGAATGLPAVLFPLGIGVVSCGADIAESPAR